MIASVDEFILFDEMQYTRRDWRNRNQIKTPQGLLWLTVPVQVKGKYLQKISETEIDGIEWAHKHWLSLERSYKRARHFAEIASWLEPLYVSKTYTHLSDLNVTLLKAVCQYLDISTKITSCLEYDIIEGKTERLLGLCQQAGATEYISGPAARDYMDPQLFATANIQLSWFNYQGYEPYPQLWGDFVHGVSVVDTLFNCGPESKRYVMRQLEVQV